MARHSQAAALLLCVVGLSLLAGIHAQVRNVTLTVVTSSSLSSKIDTARGNVKSLGGIITSIITFFTNLGLPSVLPAWTREVAGDPATGLSVAFCNGVTVKGLVISGGCTATAANPVMFTIPVNTKVNSTTIFVSDCGPEQAAGVFGTRACTGWLCVATGNDATSARAYCS